MNPEAENLLIEQALKYNISISTEQAEMLYKYYEMLIEKNKVMNLTRITEYEDVVQKHFIDSLMISRDVDFSEPLRVLDLGSGAGFPGIPLKIVFPQIRITMLDSVGKKMTFVNEVISSLHLQNAEAVHARAEELAHRKDCREQYDLCVSRAVANLSSLSEYCLPFVKTGGIFAAYKSDQSTEEIKAADNAIRILGGKIIKTDTFSLFDSGRTIILIRKIKKTPGKYPRKAGTPVKEPL